MGAGRREFAVDEVEDRVGVVEDEGEVVVTAVVRPSLVSRRRLATRASVWGSRAEVGSMARRISGSARRALTSRMR